MSVDITNVKMDLQAILHGRDIDQVLYVYNAIRRATSDFLTDIDPPETERTVQLDPVFDTVYDYWCVEDLKKDKVIDLRPSDFDATRPSIWKTADFPFDKFKRQGQYSTSFNIITDSLEKKIRIAGTKAMEKINLSSMQAINEDGTWISSGGLTDLALSPAGVSATTPTISVTLDSASSTGLLYMQKTAATDISNSYTHIVYRCYLQKVDVVTSLFARWGSSPTDYHEVQVVGQSDGTELQQGWNTLSFDLSTAVDTGTPNDEAIDYIACGVNYTTTTDVKGVKFSSYMAVLGRGYEMVYYSRFLFRDAVTGIWKVNPTDDSDIVNLEEDSYNLWLMKVAIWIWQQTGGSDAANEISLLRAEYEKQKRAYKIQYPSKIVKPKKMYYVADRGNSGYTGGIRRGY